MLPQGWPIPPAGRPTLYSAVQPVGVGTFIDSPVPPFAQQISMRLLGVSTNGTSSMLVQLLKAAGPETTGYTGAITEASASGFATSSTAGFQLVLTGSQAATFVMQGYVNATLVDPVNNTWAWDLMVGTSSTGDMFWGIGTKTMAGPVTGIRLTMVNGTDVFDLGSIQTSVT